MISGSISAVPGATESRPFSLHDCDVVIGDLRGTEDLDDQGFVAAIGDLQLILPLEVRDQLERLAGCVVGVIMIDNKVRVTRWPG